MNNLQLLSAQIYDISIPKRGEVLSGAIQRVIHPIFRRVEKHCVKLMVAGSVVRIGMGIRKDHRKCGQLRNDSEQISPRLPAVHQQGPFCPGKRKQRTDSSSIRQKWSEIS